MTSYPLNDWVWRSIQCLSTHCLPDQSTQTNCDAHSASLPTTCPFSPPKLSALLKKRTASVTSLFSDTDLINRHITLQTLWFCHGHPALPCAHHILSAVVCGVSVLTSPNLSKGTTTSILSTAKLPFTRKTSINPIKHKIQGLSFAHYRGDF